MWYRESYQEIDCWTDGDAICEDYAIYPMRFYKEIEKLNVGKRIDYCFIGGLETDIRTTKNRGWILEFIDKYFTNQSYLQFTDTNTKNNYCPKGSYDFTLEKVGFVPKENKIKDRNWFDENYFRTMLAARFALCPAGDAIFSMRFYEALMCKSIPVVYSTHETFRSEAESKLDYRYYLTTDDIQFRADWVEHNYQLFLKYHTLEYALDTGSRTGKALL